MASNKRTLTFPQVPRWHFPRIPRKWMELGILAAVFTVIVGVILWKIFTPPTPISEISKVVVIEPAPGPVQPAQSAVPVVAPVATPTPAPVRERVLGPTMMGDILVQVGEKKHINYGLGYYFIPPGSADYPQYDFPLILGKGRGNDWQTIAEIADPGLEEIGSEWTLTTKDPDQENFTLRVKLTRVGENYRYKTDFWFSPTNGESWLRPARYPVELPPGS